MLSRGLIVGVWRLSIVKHVSTETDYCESRDEMNLPFGALEIRKNIFLSYQASFFSRRSGAP